MKIGLLVTTSALICINCLCSAHECCSVAKNSSSPLALLDLIDIGLRNNSSVKNLWWAAKYAEAKSGAEKAKLYPVLTVGGKAIRAQDGATSATTVQISDAIGPYASLTYKLFQFGADKASVDSTIALLTAANFNHSHAIQRTIFDVEKAYYEFCAANELIEARSSNLVDSTTSFRSVEKKFESGLARSQDLLSAKADKLNAEYSLSASKSNLESKRASLAIAVGEVVSNDFNVKTDFNVTVDKAILGDISELMSNAVKFRSDVLSAEENIKSAELELEAAKKCSYPEIQIGFSGDMLKVKHSSKVKRDFSATVGLQWNAFDGFYKEHMALAAYSKLKMQTEAHKNKKIAVSGEVWAAFHSLKAALDGLSSANALMDAAAEALEAVRIGYDAGVNSLIDLLNAQNTLSSARLSVVQSKANVAISFAELTYCCGKQGV